MIAPGLYTIPAGAPFARDMAAGLLDISGGAPESLAQMRILLPTRRACRTLREAFLQITDGAALLLPRLQTLGDIEDDELFLESAVPESAAAAAEIKPALPPLRRQILLARLIGGMKDYTRGPQQDFALAGTLGRLMDQIYTENLDFAALPALVSAQELAAHWQVTVSFLEILSRHWPEILASMNVIDAADRRNRLLRLLAAHWQKAPPPTPVIAAGSTGSIPATALLLKTIAGLPKGYVVLPGLDRDMDEQSWGALEDTHPQATLRHLLEQLDTAHTDVQLWPAATRPAAAADRPPALAAAKIKARRWLAREMMRPAATAEHWQALAPDDSERAALADTLKDVRRFECATPEEEARVIAITMREALLVPAQTVALVTPDRMLARRVAAHCRRWAIAVDDSGGSTLGRTPLGAYLRLVFRTALDKFRPGSLMALLRHELCHLGMTRDTMMATLDRLETTLLRGPVTGSGFAALYAMAELKEADRGADLALLRQLEELFDPLTRCLEAGPQPFATLLAAHLTLAEALAATPGNAGDALLWRGEAGEEAARFLASLGDEAAALPEIDAESYIEILEQLFQSVNVRPAYGTHPRALILGQLEARLAQADVVILGGLNEKSWPPDAGNDPWMSRPMRTRFGLPAPERAIGLAAHDFIQGFCASQVVLTRARRKDGAPAVASRWLRRLDTVLSALGIEQEAYAQGVYLNWAQGLDSAASVTPARRPAPRPPAALRPQALYVTGVERWMRDPYSLYARDILRLRKLPALEEEADAAERGTILHSILNDFIAAFHDHLPPDAEAQLLETGRRILGERLMDERVFGFWWPRFCRIVPWFVNHERQWRLKATNSGLECAGTAALEIDGIPFTLKARADRIDLTAEGAAIVDYKTGAPPSRAEVEAGLAPQLPLEALILLAGGFPGISAGSVNYMGFWHLGGGAKPGEDKPVTVDPESARAGFAGLVRVFRDPQTPYYSLPRPAHAPRFQDYAHLARVQEWTALDDAGGEAGA